MKLFALVGIAAAGNWPGQGTGAGETCGSQAEIEASSVNSTCTISLNGFSADFISVASSFPTGSMEYTGFDGISDGNQDVLVFWSQGFDGDGNLDNSTCGTDEDITVTCVDNGAANDTPNLHSNFVHDPRSTSFNVAIANADENFAIDLSAFAAWNVSSGHCDDISETGDSYTCDFTEHNGKLSYLSFNGNAGVNQF